MALKKKTYTDFKITSWDFIEVRQRQVFIEDGVEEASRSRRVVLRPGDDVSAYPLRIQRVATVLWTAEAIAFYNAVNTYQTANDEYRNDPSTENETARDNALAAAVAAKTAYETEIGADVPTPDVN